MEHQIGLHLIAKKDHQTYQVINLLWRERYLTENLALHLTAQLMRTAHQPDITRF